MEVVGETDLEIPGDTAQCVFLHHPTIFLNLKRAERWEDRSMEMGKTNKLHQIPQSQPNFLYLEEENTSSAGILFSSSFTTPSSSPSFALPSKPPCAPVSMPLSQ